MKDSEKNEVQYEYFTLRDLKSEIRTYLQALFDDFFQSACRSLVYKN